MATFKHHLLRAVEIAGSQSELARRASCSQQAISFLLRDAAEGGSKNISAEMAMRIDRATGGQVRKEDLRPDLFAPTEGAAA